MQVCSLNLLDEQRPFTLRVPLEALARGPVDALRPAFDDPGRKWAAYLVGCLVILHERRLIDLADPRVGGMNLALLSTVPLGSGVSSSAAIEVATMMNLVDHLGIQRRDATATRERDADLGNVNDANGGAASPTSGSDAPRSRTALGPAPAVGASSDRSISPLQLAALCQEVENRIVGAPCGIMDQVASCAGKAGSLLRMICQPHELQPPLRLPEGVRVVGINSNVRHHVGGGQYGRTRCAAFMGHRIILDAMRDMGARAGRALVADPTGGYLANLDPDDYKALFRPHVPEHITGRDFLARHGGTIDAATTVEPDVGYAVQHATDHHVLEARRVRRFVEFLEEAKLATGAARTAALDRAGHLMYASHLSYTNDAMLGADECDLLEQLVRDRERAGIYGAKITGGGSGGTVAVLADESASADAALADVMAEYERQTARKPELFAGSSPGAWHVGTVVV